MSDMKHLPQQATPTEGAALARCSAAVPDARRRIVRADALDLSGVDRIVIEGLEVFANHGVYPEENALGQKFIVSLTLFADLAAAGAHDDLDASIDYGAVCHEVERLLRQRTFKLIEAAAEGVASELLDRHERLLAVRVRLEKPWAPVGLPLRTVAVEIERSR